MTLEKNLIRDSNFELLRIVLISMIIVLYYLSHGGALDALNPSDLNFYMANAFESLCIIAVDCFILITGYYQINGKFKLRKPINLWMQVFFYSVILSTIFWICGMEPITNKDLLGTFFPLITRRWWFITMYMTLYICSPFINTALNKIERKDYEKLLIVLAFLFVIMPSFYPNIPYQDCGYGLDNFVFLYCTGAYIRRYDFASKIQVNYLFMYFTCSLLILIGRILLQILGKEGPVFNYNFILVELGAICLFMFFKDLKIKSRQINTMATSVFGIYLISEHPFIRNVLYTKILHCADYYQSPLFVPHVFISLIGIFISCIVIEYFRQRLFNTVSMNISIHIMKGIQTISKNGGSN